MKIYDPKTILVPVDFSEASMGALQAAVDIAQKWNAKVKVLHVAKEPEHPSAWRASRDIPRIGTYHIEAYQHIFADKSLDIVQAEAEDHLREMKRKVSGGSNVEVLVMWGEPLQGILDCVKAGDFDLIVMATHGRRGLNRVLLGSVTEEIIRRAPCPVLAIREKMAKERLAASEMAQATG